MSSEEGKAWNTYLDALSSSERADVLDIWNKSDDTGRQKLIGQVKAMKAPAKDRDLDRVVRKQGRPSRPSSSSRPG